MVPRAINPQTKLIELKLRKVWRKVIKFGINQISLSL
jgi:hypothetical protein